jgi:ferric-dicitrate binding protein FerR (iron transport regulator)
MKVINKLFFIVIISSLMILLVSAGNSEGENGKTTGADPVPSTVAVPAPVVVQSPVSVQAVIEVVFYEGEVLINGQEPEIGDRLGTSFVVQTGKGSRCDIVFNSGNALSVGQNALVDFDFGSQVASVRVDRGGLSSVLKKLSQVTGTDAFTVQTATAVAGVRGTSFCVWVDESSSYICACNGVVHIQDSTGGNGELLEAAHHTARYFSKSGESTKKETAGMRHHTDDLLQSVASRIGYVIDWTTIDG